MSSTVRRLTPAQIHRAMVALALGQLLFAAWLVASMLHVALPSWAQGQIIWWVIGIPALVVAWPVMRDPEGAKKLQSPVMRVLNVAVALLMLSFFVTDRSHWGLGLLGLFVLVSEWFGWRRARREKTQQATKA